MRQVGKREEMRYKANARGKGGAKAQAHENEKKYISSRGYMSVTQSIPGFTGQKGNRSEVTGTLGGQLCEQDQKAHVQHLQQARPPSRHRPVNMLHAESYRRLWDFFLISFQHRFISRAVWSLTTLCGVCWVTLGSPAPS